MTVNSSIKVKSNPTIPSLIKWTGSKRSQAYNIKEYFPEHERYFEPFLGSGAVLYTVNKQNAIVSDVYYPLIEFWSLVQSDVWEVINNYEQQWKLLQEDLPGYFYEVRERFNQNPNGLDLSFLTRTCVNGIVRFNKKGEFNNSFHLSRKGMAPKRFENIALNWNNKLKGIDIVCQDYKEVLMKAKEGDFVYLDPPYAGSKNRYIDNLNLDEFFNTLEDLNKRNIKWALSFDGTRGEKDLTYPIPKELYEKRVFIETGNSTVGQVLNKSISKVSESLYLNY